MVGVGFRDAASGVLALAGCAVLSLGFAACGSTSKGATSSSASSMSAGVVHQQLATIDMTNGTQVSYADGGQAGCGTMLAGGISGGETGAGKREVEQVLQP